jgi:threonine/homoserine/homoserine lactone efflux protein
MSLSNGLRLGWRRSLPFNCGVWLGVSVITLLCALGADALNSAFPRLQEPLRFLGAAYLLYLAFVLWRSPILAEKNNNPAGFGAGCFLQFINAKFYLYCIVSLQIYILPFYRGATAQLLAFALLLGFIAFFFTLCYSVFGSVFRQAFRTYARVTNTVMALSLVYCATALLLAR